MTDPTVRRRREALRAEYAAEAAEAEALENEQTVVSVRMPSALADAIKLRATAEHVPASALIRRLLAEAIDHPTPTLTIEQVEEIARRVYRESA